MDTPARHSAVEDSALTPFLKRLTVYSSGGPFLDGYVLVIIGIALIQLEPQLGLDAFWTGSSAPRRWSAFCWAAPCSDTSPI